MKVLVNFLLLIMLNSILFSILVHLKSSNIYYIPI